MKFFFKKTIAGECGSVRELERNPLCGFGLITGKLFLEGKRDVEEGRRLPTRVEDVRGRRERKDLLDKIN